MKPGGKACLCEKELINLYKNLSLLSIDKTIDKLYEIHESEAVPVTLTDRDGLEYFRKITSLLLSRQNEFSQAQSKKLAKTISWEELRQNRDRSATLLILRILKCRLSRQYRAILDEHIEWILEAYSESQPDTIYRYDLMAEFSITKAMLLECSI